MQRSVEVKQVKQVIGALCRLLAATGLDSVPAPEDFRRAKFGGGAEVEDQFWQFLANILQTASIVSCEASAQLGGATEYRKLVTAGLWQTGYHADWMYGRGGEGGEGGRFSSRDLLLALGWLLATGQLEKLLTQRVQQLDKTLLTPTPVNNQFSNELQLDSASLRRPQWLIGCLRHQGRTLLSMQEERTRLLHAVFFASLPSSVSSSSSSTDQSSTALRKDCVCMQRLCDLLEAYLNWKQVEEVFWTWMDSVADCHLTDPVVTKPTHAPNGRARVCHHGNQGLDKLEDMLLCLPTGQISVGNRDTQLQTGQSRTNRDVWSPYLKDRGEAEEMLRTDEEEEEEEEEERGCRVDRTHLASLLFSLLYPACPPSSRSTEPGSRLRGQSDTAATEQGGPAAGTRLRTGSRHLRLRGCFSRQRLCCWRGGAFRDWPIGCSCRR
ncbi:tubulin epsilon and delta complex protein 1 isoform X1 [Sebastes umbrosus]|uniref:tubulin epsilon and delta complex protein 1 isoform X1 n=1 Tax=Sebastes umbrosus TaxID=72105 RepID=UPI00189FE83F|nr:tubulin epsilon and delta complex protein 1 isoform X1 [Sebastes umbrosus]